MPDEQVNGVLAAVRRCAQVAAGAAPALAAASDEAVDAALGEMAARLSSAGSKLLAANAEDLAAARTAGMSAGLVDRLVLSDARLAAMADSLRVLAAAPHPVRETDLGPLDGGLRLVERRRPVGVIGANYEARPNVTVDVASQLVKSRNAGVLRTGGAALTSANALLELVVAPALSDAGLDADAIQLVPAADRAGAAALVSLPDLVPLVILRGSGDSTRELGLTAARHGVRTLAHADGGGVLYLHPSADPALVTDLVGRSLDRLGVCNRLNLLLVDAGRYAELLAVATPALEAAGVRLSLPPQDHPIGYEWALDAEREATVTVVSADGPVDAAEIANRETSGLAAAIVAEDADAAAAFMDAYRGTGVFWNAPTRLLDGVKMLGVPETGINIDKVPGPRGPVTYPDLCLRQYAVVPADRT